MISNRLWALIGFVAAWATSVGVAFAAGCIYAVALLSDHALSLIEATGSGQKDALIVFLFAGGTAAFSAALIAPIIILAVGWPIYLLSRKLRWVSLLQYVAFGLVIAVVVAVTILSLQQMFSPLAAESDYYLEITTIVAVGPATTSIFWLVVRPDRMG